MTRRPWTGPAGYSLVELLAVVSIAATLASLAIPSYSALSRNSRRTVVVNELVATLQLARLEAAKRGTVVVICGFADANGNGALDPAERRCAGRDWTDGWIAAAWTDADHDATVDAEELAAPLRYYVSDGRQVRVRTGNFMATPPVAPPGTAVLEPFGRRSANGSIAVCDDRGPAAARSVVIAPNGRSRIVDPAAGGPLPSCP